MEVHLKGRLAGGSSAIENMLLPVTLRAVTLPRMEPRSGLCRAGGDRWGRAAGRGAGAAQGGRWGHTGFRTKRRGRRDALVMLGESFLSPADPIP